MTLTILGLGTARPAGLVEQSVAARAAEALCCETSQQKRLLQTLYRRSAVERRASVVVGNGHGELGEAFYPERNEAGSQRGPSVQRRMQAYADYALPLAVEACAAGLTEANVEPGQIDQLVAVSCTGFGAPGVDVRLIEALGLRADVGRTMIGFMGCHGAINGLRVASALAAARPGEHVLLCCVELCSLHFHYGWDSEKIVANALFADGAAAAVGRAGRDDEGERWRLRATGSRLVPDSQDAMTWTIGDHGFEMTLSARVPELIGEHLRPWLTAWLAGQGVRLEEVGSWALHPGGPRIIDAVERALDLPAEATAASRRVLAECGNMSSPTVLFIVDQLRRAKAARPCVALAFGPGLMAEVALFE